MLTGFGGEEPFIDEFLGMYAARVDLPREFALRRRVLLLSSGTGVGIDVALGALPFEESVVRRATPYEFAPGVTIRTCSAEDLIVMKLFAGRAIDVQDATGIVARQKSGLDWNYIEEQLAPVAELKEDPAVLANLRRLRAF